MATAASPRVSQATRIAWFSVLNALLLLLVSLRYLKYVSVPQGALPRAFTALSFIGHMTCVGFIPFILILPAVLLIPHRDRLISALAVALCSLLVLLLCLDTFVFALYRFHINGAVVNLLFGGAAGDIFKFSLSSYLTVMAILAGLALSELVILKTARIITNRTTLKRLGPFITAMLVSILIAGNLIYAWADANLYVPVLTQELYMPFYKPMTFRSIARKHTGLLPHVFTASHERGQGQAEGLYGSSYLEHRTVENLLFIESVSVS